VRAWRWRLVTENLGMVRACALQVCAKLPVSVEADDLVGIGTIALIGAADRFDTAAGVQFSSYARHRVRGAMLDAFRGGNYSFELHDVIYDDHSEDHSETDEGKPSVVPVDPRPSPERLAEGAVLADILRKGLEALDDVERFALLAHADGTPLREIGARWGHSVSWAHGVLRQAQSKMKRELAMHRLHGV
jgi:RNA polymerase sigma factor (sigma-70 family)